MRKSYEVGISPKINLCNSVEVLTNSFGQLLVVDKFNNSDC
ncbi:Uncharacterised protein [Escherichia coli]|uniref:Uncharacterized protein n=1 Tax=Escherichia coli TaxID=562 RepID=A0A377K9V5_ECOLX|nr:Uncharacterised protein [Escherichia coli]